jgi:hypothetical protein
MTATAQRNAPARGASSNIRILRLEPVPNAHGQQQNIVAFCDLRIGQVDFYHCRLLETEPGRLMVHPPQMRQVDPVQRRTFYKTLGSWPVTTQIAIDRAARAAWEARRAR